MKNEELYFFGSYNVTSIRNKISAGNYDFVLLIVFYLLHNYNEYFNVLKIQHFFQGLAVLLSFSFVFWLAAFFFIKNIRNLALFVLAALMPCLYYQGIEIFLNYMGVVRFEFLSKGVCIAFILVSFLFFRKGKMASIRFIGYLKVLFFSLIGYEFCLLLINDTKRWNETAIRPFVQPATNAGFPDVYLIVMDEYAGTESLQKFGIDNSVFLNELQSLNFRVIKNARSNYNYTVPSVASFLNSELISMPSRNSLFGSERYKVAIEKIYNNRSSYTFHKMGYNVFNYSPFPFKQSNNNYQNGFVPVGLQVLISMSILDELYDLLPLYLARRFASDKKIEKLVAKKTEVNKEILSEVLVSASKQSSAPRFFYIHLMMPHAPYAYTKDGRVNLRFMKDFEITDKKRQNAYVDYLFYTNTVISSFIKDLKYRTNDEAVVLLISDHGGRDLAKSIGSSASFNSFNAIFWPEKYNNVAFYEGMSNINLMPLVFSTISGIPVSLAKDVMVAY